MKRLFTLSLTVLLALGLLAGCSSSSASSDASSAAPTPTPQPVNVYDYNILTGEEKAEDLSDGQRPAAVMIDNLQAAWPQAGISDADVIYETVTEGGITRLMAVYSDYTKIPTVGPVRSARDQFVQLAMPMNAILVHIGGSVYATNLLNYYSYQDVDGYYLGTNAFAFDSERNKTLSQEHCWYTNGSMIQSGITLLGNLPTTGTLVPLFEFSRDESVTPSGGSAAQFSFSFSSVADASFSYNESTGQYLQSQFGQPHTDSNNSQQLAFKNVLVLITDVTLKSDGIVSEFDLSSGDGYYFSNGSYEKIHWEKNGVENQLTYKKEDGSTLQVNTGKSYIAILGQNQLSTLTVDGTALAG